MTTDTPDWVAFFAIVGMEDLLDCVFGTEISD